MQIKDIVNSIKSLWNSIYYEPGDTETIVRWLGGGFLTSGGTSVRFSIPLPKRMDKISTVTVNSGTVVFRKATGGYLVTSSEITEAEVLTYIDKNILTIYYISDSLDGVNNSPVGIDIYQLKLTFS